MSCCAFAWIGSGLEGVEATIWCSPVSSFATGLVRDLDCDTFRAESFTVLLGPPDSWYFAMIACEFCDLLHTVPVLEPGQRAYCSRCRGELAKKSRSPIEGTLAVALAAAVLLVMANVFPFLRLSLEGQQQQNWIATGVFGLWANGQAALAALILFTTVLAPALRILGLIYVLLPLSLGRVPPGVARALRFQEGLVSWAMLDVYMLALLVILVKLSQMGHLSFQLGSYCFIALFVMLTLVSAAYDREALWDRVEELR